MKKLLTLLVALFVAFGLISCKKDNPQPTPDPEPAVEEPENIKTYRQYALYDLGLVKDSVGNLDQFSAKVRGDLTAAYAAAETAINSAKTISTIKSAFDTAKANIANCIPLANGTYDYTGLSVDERTKLTGVVENYVVRTGLTGVTLYESGSYTLYHERVVLGTDNYIPSYGFGTLAEGRITGPLASESNDAWKLYYHSYESSDPGTAKYWDDKGGQVSDFFDYIAAGYYTTYMNASKDGYEWGPLLANEDRPIALNAKEDGTATKWKISVKTGAKDGLKYNTLSSEPARAAYNGRLVEAEDYLTPYKIMLNQHNNLFRGSEAANSTSITIKGLKEYYNATENTTTLTDDAKFDELVALKVSTDNEGVTWLEWEFTQSCNPFYAMVYINGSLYTPVPLSFVELVTLKNYQSFNADKTLSPVDNSLSLGAYTLEAWNTDQEIVYKKNPYFVHADTKYAIAGIHLKVMPGIATDEDLAVKEFLAGNLDAASLTKNYLKTYANDPRVRRVAGTASNFKLNMNACSQETWNYLFGKNGVVDITASESDYWVCEPAMSNKHFVQGLSYALDRVTVANAHGSVASASYLAAGYMADAEHGISYNNTQVHKDAINFLVDDTDGYGYSLQLAREYFNMAIDELEAEGKYTRGTKENPTVIELEIAWMYPSMEKSYHNEVATMFEDAFNNDAVAGGCYKLDVKFWAGTTWDKVYYDKLMKGRFDIGFGSISGNTYNILDYFTVLSSDQIISGSFTLNWGVDTNNPNADILVYDGVRWSFDALIMAANGETIVTDGKNEFYQTVTYDGYEYDDANKVVTLKYTSKVANSTYTGTIDKAVLVYGDFQDRDYEIDKLEYNLTLVKGTVNADGSVQYTATLPLEDFLARGPHFGVVISGTVKDGETVLNSGTLKTYYGVFSEATAEEVNAARAKAVANVIDEYIAEIPASVSIAKASDLGAVSDAQLVYSLLVGLYPDAAQQVTLMDAFNNAQAELAAQFINALPAAADFTLDKANTDALSDAENFVLALSDDVLDLIADEFDKLSAVEAKYASLLIAELPAADTIATASEAEVTAITKAYSAAASYVASLEDLPAEALIPAADLAKLKAVGDALAALEEAE